MEYHYEDFVGLIQKSIIDHWDLNALTDYKGVTLQYKDVARKIEKLHILFETAGIQPGRQDCHLRTQQCTLGCRPFWPQ